MVDNLQDPKIEEIIEKNWSEYFPEVPKKVEKILNHSSEMIPNG
jgi:hypothetical protein